MLDTLETDRLLLRSCQMKDLQDFFDYSKNPNVGPNAGWKPHESLEESKTILKAFMGQDIWAMVYKENGKMIGSLGLVEDKKRENSKARMMGYAMAEEYWGRGLMTEAAAAVLRYGFKRLGLSVITIYHYPENSRSKRVIEKCGFRYEGTLRMASQLYDGTVHDDICYSLTREEFEGQTV